MYCTTVRTVVCMVIMALHTFVGFAQDSSVANLQLKTAKASFETLDRSNAYADDLLSTSLNTLPIGVKRVVDNTEVTIAVNKAIFHASYTELSVYAKVNLPQGSGKKERTLFFGAEGIKFSHDGSILGEANLSLLEDIEIPFNNGHMSLVLKGGYDKTTGYARSDTYLAIDCKGFKEIGLDADVCFPTTFIKNADESTTDQVVRGHFKTVVSNWNDLVADITLPSFEVVGLDGFVFNLQNVVFDFSDSRNESSTHFPAGYQQKYLIPGAESLWRGVYAASVEVTLPPAFSDTRGRRPRFAASDLLIDDNGISGLFSAENILSFEQGNASGWNFSVNAFQLELEASKLLAAGFSGDIGLPFKGKNTRLNYHGMIRENNEYLMEVSTVDSLDFSIFNAKASILPNSYVALHVVNGKFRPEAMLHGSMSIVHAGDAKLPVKIPALSFRSLLLKTESPYISVEYLGYNGKVSLGQFPISLSDISFRSSGQQVELASNVELTLADGMFAGKTRLAFAAALQQEDGRSHWQYQGTRIDEIDVNANIAETIRLKGTVGWSRNDPTYGEGFYGDLVVALTKPCKVEVSMSGRFGRVDGFRYWFVEGGVVLPMGIPIVGLLTMKGMSGAVSHQMMTAGARSQGSGAFSKARYIPDKDTGLGLKAAVLLNVGSIAHGEACFDIAFSNRGGLNFIGFYGYAEFSGGKLNMDGLSDKYGAILDREGSSSADISAMKQMEPNKAAETVCPIPEDKKSGIMGSLGIQYDFRNHSLHAQTELMINVAGGFIQGTGSGHKAGWGILHFAPDEWYVHLGAPDNRVGIQLNLGILKLRTGSYLMAGSRIPAMPAPPQEVADILHEDLSRLTLGRNMDMLGTAKGFAFGSDFQVKTGDITFLMLYANFMAGLGFDIMLKDYGKAECRGRSGAVGINGWYAQGQSYAYLQGELGVKIKLWFIKTKIPIIKGGAATLMQAMLPNPAYFKGYLGVNINILGLIKGNVRFRLALGEECDLIIPGSSPIEMVMINDLSPQDGDTNVSVFTMPQATFNTVIGKPFEAEDDEGIATYRIQLKSFTVTDDKGETVRGKLKWNSNKDAVMFQAKEILPPGTQLKAEVQVSFDKLDNGQWNTVYTSGQESVELKTCLFTTGGAPEYIPMENITYTYPVVDQRYYLPKETNQGFVQLQFGQKYLFEKGFDYKLYFKGEDKNDIPATFRYEEEENRLAFTVPELKGQQKYALRLAYTPNGETETPSASADPTDKQILDSEDGALAMSGKDAVAGVNTSIEKSILDYHFTTSKYTSFRQKMDAMKTKGGAVAEDAGVSVRLLYNVQADEAFDEAEVAGTTKTGGLALVRPYAEMKESFFTNIVHPLVYKDYPFGGIQLQHREESEMGIPPVKSVFVYSPYLDLIQAQPNPTRFFFPYSYETGIVTELDFGDLQSQVINNRFMVSPEIYNRFATSRLPFLKKGKYKTVLRYVLPDGKETSTYDFDFNNFLKLNE